MTEHPLRPSAAVAQRPEVEDLDADGGAASPVVESDAGEPRALIDAGSEEPVPDGPEILTQRYDNGRTGANLQGAHA